MLGNTYGQNNINDFVTTKFSAKLKGEDVEIGMDALKNSHFEYGNLHHGDTYYFAKRTFQSSKDCDNLALLLSQKLEDLGKKNSILIGFRSYLGLLLKKTQNLLDGKEYTFKYAMAVHTCFL